MPRLFRTAPAAECCIFHKVYLAKQPLHWIRLRAYVVAGDLTARQGRHVYAVITPRRDEVEQEIVHLGASTL